MANEVKKYLHDGMELPFEDWSKTLHSFNDLASIVQTTHDAAQSSAVKAINRMQTHTETKCYAQLAHRLLHRRV